MSILLALGVAIILSIQDKLRRGIILVGSDQFMGYANIGIIMVGILLIGVGFASLSSDSRQPQVNYEELLDKKIADFVANN